MPSSAIPSACVFARSWASTGNRGSSLLKHQAEQHQSSRPPEGLHSIPYIPCGIRRLVFYLGNCNFIRPVHSGEANVVLLAMTRPGKWPLFFWVWASRLSNHDHRYHKTCGAMEGSTEPQWGLAGSWMIEGYKLLKSKSITKSSYRPACPERHRSTLLKLQQTNSTSCIQALNSETRQFEFDGAEMPNLMFSEGH